MFGRGTRRRAPQEEPEEPVSAGLDDSLDDDTPLMRQQDLHLADTLPPDEALQPVVAPAAWRFEVRPLALIGVVLLVAVVVAAALGLLDQIPADVWARWPLAVVGLGIVLLLVGLVTARPAGTLLGPVVAAVGVFALLPTPFAGSGLFGLIGLIIVALGVGILLRGVTMVRT